MDEMDGSDSIWAEGNRVGEVSFQLTGRKAIAALALLIAIVGIRFSLRFPSVTDDGREALRAWLVDDYEGWSPGKLAQAASDYQPGLPLNLPARPAVAPRVEFVALAAHGSRYAMIVQAEVTVDGGPPPDGRSFRYLYLVTKVGGGWMVMSETTSFRYHEALLG
jgi:hypothetical protein